MSGTGLRSHALGMVVEGRNVTLCFFDREGVIHTDTFDFIQQFDLFATILVCHHLLDAYQWGFHSFLQFPKGLLPHMGTDKDAVTVDFNSDMTVRLDSTLHKQHGLVGRGTVVYNATVLNGPVHLLNKEVVVKTAWQDVGQAPEEHTIRTARERFLEKEDTAKYAKNIPTVYASCQGVKLSSLRSKFRPKSHVEFEDRIMRIVVLPRYYYIGRLRSIFKIAKCFKDIFYCKSYVSHPSRLVLIDDCRSSRIISNWHLASRP